MGRNRKPQGVDKDDFFGINLLKEDDYSAFNTELDFWNYEEGFPLKSGTTFPSDEMSRRANINYTMNKLISNEFSDVLGEFIYTFPDLDPVTNMKIANITAALPIFDSVMRAWKLILKPCVESIRINGEDKPELLQALSKTIDSIIKNKFSSCDRVDVVYKKSTGPKTKIYTDKNIILFRDENDDHIITLSNVKKNKDGRQFVEFISYLPSGKIQRDEFEYNSNKLGKHIVENEEIDSDSFAYFIKNGSTSSEYGYPELSGSISSCLAVIRAFSTLTYLIEKKRNIITLVPDTAIRKDPYTGASAFVGGSVVSYDTVNPETAAHNHDVKIESAKLDIKEAIDALEAALKQVSIYSGLSGVILGYQTVTGNESGKALLASSIPTMFLATGYLDDIKEELEILIKKYCEYLGFDVSVDKIDVVITQPDNALVRLVSADEVNTL